MKGKLLISVLALSLFLSACGKKNESKDSNVKIGSSTNKVVVNSNSTTSKESEDSKESANTPITSAFDKEFVDSDSNIADLYWQKLIKQAKKLTPYFTVYVLWDQWDLLGQKDSPADRGKDVLEALMKNKIEVRTKME